MRHLLEPVLLRQLSQLENLYHFGPMHIDDLADQFQLSPKTIEKDLQEAAHTIAPVTINCNSGGLYSLHFPPAYSLDYVYSCFLRDSARVTLLELLFFHDKLS